MSGSVWHFVVLRAAGRGQHSFYATRTPAPGSGRACPVTACRGKRTTCTASGLAAAATAGAPRAACCPPRGAPAPAAPLCPPPWRLPAQQRGSSAAGDINGQRAADVAKWAGAAPEVVPRCHDKRCCHWLHIYFVERLQQCSRNTDHSLPPGTTAKPFGTARLQPVARPSPPTTTNSRSRHSTRPTCGSL